MIYKNKKEVNFIYIRKKTVATIYKAGRIVWQSIHSCFGGGYWRNDLGWDNNDGWKEYKPTNN